MATQTEIIQDGNAALEALLLELESWPVQPEQTEALTRLKKVLQALQAVFQLKLAESEAP